MATNPFDYAERFNRPRRAPEPSPVDPVGAEIERMREEHVQATLTALPEPDQAARVTRLAREAEVEPFAVEDDTASVEAALRARRFTALTRAYPAIGKFAVQNPRGAAAAQDDHEALGVLGTAWDFLKNAPGRLATAGAATLKQAIADPYNVLIEQPARTAQTPIYAGFSALSQATGLEWLDPSSMLKAGERRTAAIRAGIKGDIEAGQRRFAGKSPISEGLLQGVDSSALTLAAIATRNPTLAATVMGVSTASTAIREAQDQGLSVPAALRYGVVQGAIEGGTELIPAGTLVEQLTKRLPFGRAVVKELWQEMLGEQTATVLQDMNDWAMLPENRGKTVQNYIDARPGAAAQTALAVLGGTGTTTTAIATVNKATELGVKAARRVGEARQARAEAAFLDRAAKAVAGSKLVARDKEAARELFREQAQDAGVTNMYIPADRLSAYQRSGDWW